MCDSGSGSADTGADGDLGQQSARGTRGGELARGPSASAFLFTIFGEYAREPGSGLWTGAVLTALAEFGFGAAAGRRALSRASAAGWLIGTRRGRAIRWSAAAPTLRHFAEAADDVYRRRRTEQPWDGSWLVITATVPESQRARRHQWRTRLRWAGFGPLGQGIWVSPRVADEQRVKAIVDDLGLGASATSFVGRLGPVGTEYDIVRQAWDLGALARDYREFVRSVTTAHPPATPREMFARLTRMVHQWRGFALRDPMLPAVLLPARWDGHRARECFYRVHDAWFEPAAGWLQQLDSDRTP